MAKKTEEFTDSIVAEPKAKKAEATGLYTQKSYVINLPLSSSNEDDVVVGINGTLTKIQRGVDVEVSAAIYEVLKNRENMDNLAYQRRKKLINN